MCDTRLGGVGGGWRAASPPGAALEPVMADPGALKGIRIKEEPLSPVQTACLEPKPEPVTTGYPGDGQQALFLDTVLSGDYDELERLLDRGGLNVNGFGCDGETALHLGCREGNLKVVKVLLRFGADVRLCNRDGWSALHLACWGGHQHVVVYLLNAYKAANA